MTRTVLNIENLSAARAIRALVRNMTGVRIVSDSKTPFKESAEGHATGGHHIYSDKIKKYGELLLLLTVRRGMDIPMCEVLACQEAIALALRC